MKIILKILLHIIVSILLTVLTQIGGIIYLLSIIIAKLLKLKKKRFKISLFLITYLLATYFIVPKVAPLFGREKIKHSNNIKPATIFTLLSNRNYVVPEMNLLLQNVESKLSSTNIQITYLDANFPFFDGFPLIPHLSHNDGKKLDLSLIYEDEKGNISKKQKSLSGYGFFEDPKPNEINQIEKCKNNGFYQYDLASYLQFGKINQDLIFSENGTKQLINEILKHSELSKIFIEPHLKLRLKLNHSKVRYHGCQAVRHDDHIHIELK